LASSGSYTKPSQIRIAAEIGVSSTNGGGLGFWSAMPARSDSASSLTGFTGLNLKGNGNLQLYVNGAAVGSPVATFAITASTLYPLTYDVDTTTGAISNIVFNGNPVSGITSTGFTNASTAYAGVFSGAGARARAKNITITPVSVAPIQILTTGFVTNGTHQNVDGTTIGLTANLPGGNWIWGAGWNWGAPYVPATYESAPYNCLKLAEEKTALGHSLASSGSYTKPAHIRISADIGLDTTRANGGGLGFWSAMPARSDSASSLTGFTGLNLKSNGTLQLYVNGSAVGSPVSVGALTNGTFYNLSYNVDTATGAISSVVFNGAAVSGISSTGFTNAATAYAGVFSAAGARAQANNITISSW
jgi:hypothetical protein